MINKTGFVLVKPQLPENIGFSARCLKNFGFSSLDLVNPKESWPNKRAIATSVGAKDILKKTKVFSSVEKAKFRKPIVPGDQLTIYMRLIKKKLNLCKFDGVCKVDDEIVADAIFSANLVDRARE